jgi:chromosome segregation protein
LKEDLSDNNNGSNNEIKVLKARISELEAELKKKENEVLKNLDTIENLEDTVMKLESLFPDEEEDKKSKKQKLIESKMALELEEKEMELRDLKNRMGFLRKEKIQLQQELEKIKKKESTTSIVINTEDLKVSQPLEVLVKELQDKVNKQKSIIRKIKREYININEFNDKLKEQEEILEKKLALSMQKQIDNQKEIIKSQKKTIEDLQNSNENIKKRFETLEIQIKIKDQKIEDLKSQIKPKSKRK